jgi:hypothetical protein
MGKAAKDSLVIAALMDARSEPKSLLSSVFIVAKVYTRMAKVVMVCVIAGMEKNNL